MHRKVQPKIAGSKRTAQLHVSMKQLLQPAQTNLLTPQLKDQSSFPLPLLHNFSLFPR